MDLLLVNIEIEAYCKAKCINKNFPASVGLTTKQLIKRECHSFTCEESIK